MNVHRTPVAAAVALLIVSAAGGALAQTAPQPADQPAPAATEKPDEGVQTIEVLGIRGALQRSLNVKRAADTRVEVITAEDIGKMPDKNVADSLQRVPGVTISSASATEGGFDENDRVSMRGTNPSLTQTLVNGHAVASGDWFVLNQTSSVGRSVSYSLLPSELVQSVVVHKSSEASLVEGGVAGSVNIITRKPLQFREPFTAELALGAVYADQPGKTAPQFNGLFNWKNEQGTLGVMLQAFSETRHLRRDGQEILGYEQITADMPAGAADPDLVGVWYPALIGSALFEQKRERNGGLIDVQIKPSSALTMDLTAFHSGMNAGNYNRNYMLWGRSIMAGQAPDAGYVVENNTLTSASFSGEPGRVYGVYDQISRPDASSDTSFMTLEADWAVSDRLSLNGQIGHTVGHGKTPTQDVAEWNVGAGGGASWQLNGLGSAASWALGNTDPSSPGGAALGWIFGDQDVNVLAKESFAKLDGAYELDDGLFTTLKFGLRATTHERSSANVVGQGPACKDASGNSVAFDWSQQYFCPAGSESPFDPANFPSGTQTYPSDFAAGLGGSFPRNVWAYSPAQLAAYNAAFTDRSTDGSRQDWASEFGLKERTTAAYLQGDFSAARFSGNVGLRLVQTTIESTTNTAVNAVTPGAVLTSAFGPYLPVTVKHTYTDVLPSANLKYKLGPDMLARFALSKTMTRPDYSALAGVVSLSPPDAPGATGGGTGGNPDLEPVRSTNLDATLEWYFAPRSLVSAGVYYMDLSSYIGYGRVEKQFLTFSNAFPEGFVADYVLSVPVNTSGKVKGIELAYEQPLFTNFGFATNYTYTDAHEAGGGPLVGASRNTYNLVGYYEDDKLNVRVAYNYRSSFFSGLDRSTAYYQDDTTNLAASIGYKLTDDISISLDGRNLNNPKLKYYALGEYQPRSVYQNGRQYFLTLRVKI